MPRRSSKPTFNVGQILTAITASIEDAIVARDLAGLVLSWSRGAERMYGYSADEMVGHSLERLLPPGRERELVDTMQRVVAGQRVTAYETVRLTKSGDPIDVSISMSPIHDDDGSVVGALAIARDITAQRRAEQDLRQSEARWRAIVESAVDAVITIDRRGRLESFNYAAERMFGYSAADVLGRNVSILMPEPYASEHDSYIDRHQRTGERRVIGIGRELPARRSDGTLFPAHLAVGEFVLDGEPMYTGIIRDLTERVSLEERIRQEAGLVRIGEMAAVLAHEVKNPLAAVSGAIQMLSAHLDADEHRAVVHEVLRRLEGLGALMTDLLLYARPSRPQLVDVELSGLLRALVEFLAADPAWSELDVQVEAGSFRVPGDPELLKVAFQNILVNAAQAVGARGVVRVALEAAGNLLYVDIADSGAGMPPAVREKVFTPFFTTKARGTGLGLATVRQIIEAHGGTVAILRTGEDGTTVRVTLPATWATAAGWRDS